MPDSSSPPPPGKEIATLGGGCFWCIEAALNQLKGVDSAESGYMGGKQPNPTYEAICTGVSGHAEVVQVTFDPSTIIFREILEVFFALHDPTTLNRQGNDMGTQYRSVVFYHSPDQEATVKKVIETLTNDKLFDSPIVTEVSPAQPFYMGEDYHQEYFVRNPTQPYCTSLIGPKIAKFRKQFESKLKV